MFPGYLDFSLESGFFLLELFLQSEVSTVKVIDFECGSAGFFFSRLLKLVL